ncbi:aldo/keto reductase [Dyadobacter sp. 32]|uniref:aldo/keto reductase n=1 Tax=Dyadobacter sp. 32 TaxID=538966 RepID=UPI0011EE7D3E
MEFSNSRRNALKTMSLVGSAMLLPSYNALAQNKDTILQRLIPSSGEELPIVGVGSWQQFDVGATAMDREPLREVLKSMDKMGGKVIDASPMYGRSEKVIGDLTTELRLNDRLFLATKVWTTGRQAGIDQMKDSISKMGRTKIDLMQVHNLQDYQTHLRTLKDWKEQGRIRYIGVTHYVDSAHARLEQIVKAKVVDFVQFNYSIGSRHAEGSLLKAARDHGVAVLINEPFEQGALFRVVKGKALPPWAAEIGIASWAQFFLKYILGDPAVTCVIPGTSDVKHLIDNMGAGMGPLPDQATRKKMLNWMGL